MNINNVKYCIETSKEGLPTISILDNNGKGIYLHSKFFPSKESESLKEELNPNKYDAIIVLGAGLGYHLMPLKGLISRYKKIIILDAVDNIEVEIEKNPKTKFLKDTRKITFLSGKSIEKIESILSEMIDLDDIKGLNVLEHPPSMRVFYEYYKDIKKIIDRLITRKAGNMATKRAFGMLYLRNILKNYRKLSIHYPVLSFFDKIAEYPALVITTGPSLEKYIKMIREFQRYFFIITVDSSLAILLHNRIEPDFFISIDPQPFVYEHLIDVDLTRTIPIYTVSSNPLIFNNYSGLLSLNTHPISQIINDLFPNRIGSIDSLTGTVAGDAVNAATLFGFNRIGMIGFDFSFLYYNIYPRGTSYQNRFSYTQNRFTPLESANLNYIMKSSKGMRYNNRFTRRSFINYKQSLEEYIKKKNIQNLYNFNTSGIKIEGIQNITFEYFLNNFCSCEIKKSKLISRTLSKSKKIGNIIPYDQLKEPIEKREYIKEIVQASLDKDTIMHKMKSLRLLISKEISNNKSYMEK